MTPTMERGSIKKLQVDRWSARERLCLASAVSRSGDQNWMSVSRSLRVFGEPNRPSDWFSQKNCAVQYSMLLENVETPKRKKRAEKGEVHVETPGECILRKLTTERIEELKRLMQEERADYLRLKEEVMQVKLGHVDDKLQDMVREIKEEKRRKEKAAEAHQQWLREREEKKLEMERNWKQVSSQIPLHRRRGGPSRSGGTRRSSSQSDHDSEADSPVSEPSNADITGEDLPVDVRPTIAPIPTSPLLTSLLKSPSPAPSAQTSRLQQAITSRGSSPTITSLLSSSPAVPTTVSSGLKNLVSSALSAAAASNEHPVTTSVSPSAGAPTLSMLLELPPSLPGKPLPEIPIAASKAVLPPAVKDDKRQSHQETPSLTAGIKDSETGTVIPIEPKIESVEDIIHIEPKEETVEEELIEEMVISDDAVLAPDDIPELGDSATDDVPVTTVVTEELQTVIKKELIDEYTSECEAVEPIMQIKMDPDEDLSAHEPTSLESDIREVKTELEDEENVTKIEHVTEAGDEIVLDKDFEMIIEGTMQELTDEGDLKGVVPDIDEVVEFDDGTEVKEVMTPDLADMEVIILGKVDNEVVHDTEEAKLLEVVVKEESSDANVHSNIPDELPSVSVSNETKTAEETKCTLVPALEIKDVNITQSSKKDVDDSHDNHNECVEYVPTSSVDSTVTEKLSVKNESETSVQVSIKEDNLPKNSEFSTYPESTDNPNSRTIVVGPSQESEPVPKKHHSDRAQGTKNDNIKHSVKLDPNDEENVSDINLEVSNDLIHEDANDKNVSNLKADHSSVGPSDSLEIVKNKISDENEIVASVDNKRGPDLRPEEDNKNTILRGEKGKKITKREKRDAERKNSALSKSHANSTLPTTDHIDSSPSDHLKLGKNKIRSEETTEQALSKEVATKSSINKISKNEDIITEKPDSHVISAEKETTLKDSTNTSLHGVQNVPTHTKKNRKGSRKDSCQKDIREIATPKKDMETEVNKESSPKQSGETGKNTQAEKKESSKESNRIASKKEEKDGTHRRDGSIKRKDADNNDEREDIKKRAVVKDEKRDVISKESLRKEQEVEISVKKVETKKPEKSGRTESKKDTKKNESKREDEIKLKSVEVTLEPMDIKSLNLPQEDTTESECESEKTSSKDSYRENSTPKDSRKSHVDIQVASKGGKINVQLSRAETPSTEEEKTSDVESTKPSLKKRLAGATIESLPGSPVFSTTEDEREYKAWKKSIMLVYGRLATHKYASLFLRPITDDQAPGYSSIVHRPMDLLMIKKNIETGMIRTTSEFQRDVLLMFQNAIMYNKSSHFVHKMAHQMQEEGMQHIQDFLTTQMLVQVVGEVPLRRETRTTEANKNRDVSSAQEEPETGGKRKRMSGPEKESLKKRKV